MSKLLVPLLMLWLTASACASVGVEPRSGAPAADTVMGTEAVRWTVATRQQVDLWYHGLAYAGVGAVPELTAYVPGYVERIVAAKRVAGAYPTVLDQRASEFAQVFSGDARYQALGFLPLYFSSGEALFRAFAAWVQAGGDPRRVRDPALAQAVAFLSQQFPTAEQRRTIAGWVQTLQQEDAVFYGRYWAARQQEYAGTAAAVQARWDVLAPRIQPVLDYLMLNAGEVLLSLPLGQEGRSVTPGRRSNRVAVLMPPHGEPADAVWALLHELMYPYVQGVIRDQLSPAQLRETREDLLSMRAAVRAGALLLDQAAPPAAAEYRAAYLRWAGQPVPSSVAARQAALERAYPLPDPLPRALADGLQAARRGF